MSQDGKWPFDSESMREVQRLFKEAKEANQKDAGERQTQDDTGCQQKSPADEEE